MRLLRFLLWGLLGLLALGAALIGIFIYTPDPVLPALSARVEKGSISVGGLERTYLRYVPQGLAAGAPLVVVMHGSGQRGGQIRVETGYGFERLADQHRFAVVYPDAAAFDWNDCSQVGDYRLHGVAVDDKGFLTALVDHLIADIGSDRHRVFATGVSAGGSMAIRLALEEPSRFRAVAAVAANVPTPANFKCTPVGQGTSVLIMNGTKDPLVPFDGGEINLLGLFYQGGAVRSSLASARFFAERNQIAAEPVINRSVVGEGVEVEQTLWRSDARAEVELVAVQGGGHGLPQPHWRRPRLLGPSPMAPDGPAWIWGFFARQKP